LASVDGRCQSRAINAGAEGQGNAFAVIFSARKNVRNPEGLGVASAQRQTAKFAMIWTLLAMDR